MPCAGTNSPGDAGSRPAGLETGHNLRHKDSSIGRQADACGRAPALCCQSAAGGLPLLAGSYLQSNN